MEINPQKDWKISDLNYEAPKLGGEDTGQFTSEECPFCDSGNYMEAAWPSSPQDPIWHYECHKEDGGCGAIVVVESQPTKIIQVPGTPVVVTCEHERIEETVHDGPNFKEIITICLDCGEQIETQEGI